MEHDFLSVLSIYPRIFLSVLLYIVSYYGISYCVKYSIVRSCVLVVLV